MITVDVMETYNILHGNVAVYDTFDIPLTKNASQCKLYPVHAITIWVYRNLFKNFIA